MTHPVGLNLDAAPGPDGFSIKVFFDDGSPKPVPFRKGTLEVLMFDGTLPKADSGVQPLKTWRFTPEEIREHEFKAGIGTGYELSLAWGENEPTQRNITVAARYLSPLGASIYSAPSSVTVASR
jgi:hypothetical protein